MNPLDLVVKHGQECIKKTPLILLGSGASAAYGIPGMWPLGEKLSEAPLPPTLDDKEIASWNRFLDVLPKTNLEQALTEVPLSTRLTRHVVETTWDYLNEFDLAVFEKVCFDRQYLALTKLFRFLFQSTVKEINVVTPNYDRLAEYAANANGYSAYTGFSFGMIAQRAAGSVPRVFEGAAQARTVNVWKVHGSFGWFSDLSGVIVAVPPMHKRPAGMDPIIITPGIEKYQRTHDEPFRTIMHCADRSMLSATGFLCIGYGFNDRHLQTQLVERCQNDASPLVLLTQKISDPAHELLKSGKCRQYLALEQNGNATKIYCNEIPNGTEIPESNFWMLDGFLKLIM